MKKIFMFLAAGVVALSLSSIALAADKAAGKAEPTVETTEVKDSTSLNEDANNKKDEAKAEVDAATPIHQRLKEKFIEGDPKFMSLVIVCLILGLAVAIERIVYLSLCKCNTKRLLADVEAALQNGGVEAAKELCRNTRGPVASIFYQGLLRADQGLDVVEKTIVSYGSVQMSNMEKGLSWVGLFIAIAPSLGFLGTVIGMIKAFDDIEKASDMSPAVVAGGMKVALITTVGGLIVALILQVFYNLILSMIDTLSIEMEDASISFVDTLTKYNK